MRLTAVPLQLVTDLGLGGRWESLTSRTAGNPPREWLWTNPQPRTVAARPLVNPDDAFVDAGGGEECFPSLRSPYDHGLVWNRPWVEEGEWASVEAEGHRLRRRIRHDDGAVVVDYEATSDEPRPALHATHLLLQLSQGAVLDTDGYDRVVFYDNPPVEEIASLGGEGEFVRALGDGLPGAVCYLLDDCSTVRVVDGSDVLELSLTAPSGLPHGVVVWRNHGGWPEEEPYRSLGVEPMLGADVSLPSDSAITIGPEPTRWTLTVRAFVRG